jgi:hypothetical protein
MTATPGTPADRTFANALFLLLESDFQLLGSRRMLRVLAEAICELIAQFYPAPHHVQPGALVWRTTQNTGRKASPGQTVATTPGITVILPLFTPADCAAATAKSAVRRELLDQRLVRLLQTAAAQGGLLTLAELSLLTNSSMVRIHQALARHYESTGQLLPLKGYVMDQGARPSHKADIVRSWELGYEPPEIARLTQHSLKAVERYIQDYKAICLLLEKNLSVADICAALGHTQALVLEYIALACQYHPQLNPEAPAPGQVAPY